MNIVLVVGCMWLGVRLFAVGSKSITRAVAVVSLILGFVSIAQAETRVFPGEYIIEQGLAALSESEGEDALEREGFEVTQNMGARRVVVRSRLQAFGDDAPDEYGAVPYDNSKDDCSALLAAGVATECSPNYLVTISRNSNDPSNDQTWGLSASQGADAYGAWDVSTGSSDVVVAVIDTGIDLSHPDLRANLWVNAGEVPGNGVDDDGNGYVDDVHGINAANKSGNPNDDNGHGTHCAGVIGAVGNNATGIAGINWNVKLMALKFLTADGGGRLSDSIIAIDYMVAMKRRGVNVRVANNSWGGGGYSALLENAIAAANQVGIVFPAAAGNEGNDNDSVGSYPANFQIENVVSVAAIDRDQNLASFSNYGAAMVDIAAPGVQIYSTYRGGAYRLLSGTSMATPHVAGALALLSAANPSLSVRELIARLYDSAVPKPGLAGVTVTGRALNIGRMLRGDTNPIQNPVSNVCQYGVTAIGFNPDRSADDTAAVVKADEFGFTRVSLPFTFPFHQGSTGAVVLSPNGLIYTDAAPTQMDYQIGARAPLNSIAALHTDLSTVAGGLGVRVAARADRVVITWDAVHYRSQDRTPIKATLVLYPDGTIDSFLNASDAAALAALQTGALIGLTGPTVDSGVVAASNSQLTSQMAFRYTRSCPAVTPAGIQMTSASLYSLSPKGAAVARLVPGGQGRLTLQASGQGQVAGGARFSVNGQVCSDSVPVALNGATTTYKFSVPRSLSRYRRLSAVVTVGGVSIDTSARIRLSSSGRGKRGLNRARRASSRQRIKSCGELVNSFRPAQ